jgi:hypothetical protein
MRGGRGVKRMGAAAPGWAPKGGGGGEDGGWEGGRGGGKGGGCCPRVPAGSEPRCPVAQHCTRTPMSSTKNFHPAPSTELPSTLSLPTTCPPGRPGAARPLLAPLPPRMPLRRPGRLPRHVGGGPPPAPAAGTAGRRSAPRIPARRRSRRRPDVRQVQGAPVQGRR